MRSRPDNLRKFLFHFVFSSNLKIVTRTSVKVKMVNPDHMSNLFL